MNYHILSQEINEDPLGIGYASMDAYQIRDSLNNKTRQNFKLLSSNDLLKWSGINGRYIKVKKASEDPSLSDEVRSAAYTAVVMVERDNTVFDLNDPKSQSIMNILVDNGILSQEDKNDLIADIINYISRTEELRLPPVRKKDVEKAQNGG